MLLSNAGVFGALSSILDSDQLRDLSEARATTGLGVVYHREDVACSSGGPVCSPLGDGGVQGVDRRN